MRRTFLAFAAGVAVLLASAAPLAHHGTNASYDPKKETTLTGVVTKFIMSHRSDHERSRRSSATTLWANAIRSG